MRLKKIIVMIIILSLVFSFTLAPPAHAAVTTVTLIGAAATAALVTWGIVFTATHASQQGINHFAETSITEFLGERTVVEVFGPEIAYTSGILTMSNQAYNAIIDYKEWLEDKYDLGPNNTPVQQGKIGSTWINEQLPLPGQGTGISANFSNFEAATSGMPYAGYRTVQAYWNNGTPIFSGSGKSADAAFRFNSGATITVTAQGSNYLYSLTCRELNKYNGAINDVSYGIATYPIADVTEGLQWKESSSYSPPVAIPDSKGYAITIGDSEATTISELADEIYQKIAENDISAEGEIIDIAPAPTPQPVPSFPPLPPPIPVPIDPGVPIADSTVSEVHSWAETITENIASTFNGLESIFELLSTVIVEGINHIEEALQDILAEMSGALRQALDDIKTAVGALAGWLQRILEQLQSMGLSISQIVSAITGALQQALDAIREAIGALAGELEAIIEAIQAAGGSIAGILSDILEAIGDLAGTIEEATTAFMDALLDAIWTPLLPIFNKIKASISIWHYVVQWLQCINAPFTFFWQCLTGLGQCFPMPIYAVAAATIVLAVYKRFGR